MKINCLIIEDNLIDREIILGFASKIPLLNVVATCSNVLEASTHVGTGKVDLILSDIEMADLSGLDFVKSLANPPYTIFITSFPGYAVEGFQVAAIDYLVKPITLERLLKAVTKVQAHMLKDKGVKGEEQADHFFIRADGQYVKLNYADVLYIEANADFTKIYTTTGRIMALVNLKNMEEQLPQKLFIRVHRSFLVNISKIERVDENTIIIARFSVPLGNVYKEKIYKMVDKKLVSRFAEGSSGDS